jgi:putative membrane protein
MCAMNLIAQILAVLVGVLLIGVGVLEVFFYRDQRFNRIFLIKPQDADAVRLWTVNVGFYNILMGIGIIVGVVLVNLGQVDAGRAIVWLVCISHFILGITLALVEPRLWKSTIGESGLPLLTMIALLF